MSRPWLKISLLLIGLTALLLCRGSLEQAEEESLPIDLRYFDTAPEHAQEIRLVVFPPTSGDIQAFLLMKEQGIFAPGNLLLIGVYHENEHERYSSTRELVRQRGLDWLKFHRLEGNLNQDNLYSDNPFSEEFHSIVAKSDGAVIFGGPDIPPYVYREKTHFLTGIRSPYRHFVELSFVFHLLGGYQDETQAPLIEQVPEYPLLGLCLGHQTLNVGTGGSLYQDVWTEVYGKAFLEDVIHLPRDFWHVNPLARLHPEAGLFGSHMHAISLLAAGKFVSEWGFDSGDQPYIVSAHHQAVNKLGKGFQVIATSLDGKVVEAIAHTKHPHVLGVQFHPESRSLWDRSRTGRVTLTEEETTYFDIMENHPPSLEFHQKIWSWFSEKLEAYHSKK
jgi:putative glutamine amidotransferase